MATYSGGGEAVVKEFDKTEYISDPTSRKKGTNTPTSETLKLVNPTKTFHGFLQLTKLYTVFDVKDDEAGAINSFNTH